MSKEDSEKRRFGPYTVQLARLSKVFFPDSGITKGDLVDYYQQIADALVPHVRDRPLTLLRHPDGIEASGFFQKDIPDYFPEWIERVEVKKQGGSLTHPLCQNAASLVYMANQGMIEPHPWLSRQGRLNAPDKLIFDLDPPSKDFAPVRRAAFDLRELLTELDLAARVMTTGKKGLHVIVPLDRSAGFDEARELAKAIAEVLVSRHPDRYTIAMRKKDRKGNVFLDYLRNAYAQTSVAPYGVRAVEGAPVATPLSWEELDDEVLHAGSFTIRNVPDRVSKLGDVLSGMGRHGYSVARAKERLERLRADEGG